MAIRRKPKYLGKIISPKARLRSPNEPINGQMLDIAPLSIKFRYDAAVNNINKPIEKRLENFNNCKSPEITIII